MRPNVLGIDPGKSGALAIISIQKPRTPIALDDLPLVDKDICGRSLSTYLDLHRDTIRFCVLEKVSAMKYTDRQGQVRGQGAAASFAFGKGYGIVLGCLQSAGIPLIEVVPSVWKILCGLTSSKTDSLQRARELFPSAVPKLTLKKHDGRAEALLLAHFGAERFGNLK